MIKTALLTILFILMTSISGAILISASFVNVDLELLAISRFVIILGGSFILNFVSWNLFNRNRISGKPNISSKSLFYVNSIIASLFIGLTALTYVLMRRDGTYTDDEIIHKPAIFLAIGCVYLGAAISVACAYKRHKNA